MSSDFGIDSIPTAQLTPDTAHIFLVNNPELRFPLNQLRTVIGRNDPPTIIVDLDLTTYDLNNPPSISRRHAEIQWVNGKLQIVDLDSTNGTFVDGKKLSPKTPVTIQVGSRIKLGNLELEAIAL